MRDQKRSSDAVFREWQVYVNGRLAVGTIDDYSRDILSFRKSAKGLRLESIRLMHLEEHVGSLAPAHRRRAIAALRNSFAYAPDEGRFKSPSFQRRIGVGSHDPSVVHSRRQERQVNFATCLMRPWSAMPTRLRWAGHSKSDDRSANELG